MPLSPLCQVQVNSSPYVATPNGVDANPGDTIGIALVGTASVAQWYLQVIGTDELSATPTLSNVNPSTYQVSSPSSVVNFVLPSGAGQSYLIQSTVTGPGGPLVTTFSIFVLTANGDRVGSVGETREGSTAYGWTTKLNPILRLGAAYLYYNDGIVPSPSIGTTNIQGALDYFKTHGIGVTQLTGDVLAGPGSGAQPATVLKIHGSSVPVGGALTIGNTLQVTGAAALSYGPLNLAGGSSYFTGALPVANLAHGTAAQLLVTNAGGTAPAWVGLSQDASITDLGALTVTGLKGTSIPNLTTGFLYYNGATFSWDTLGGDLTPGATSGGIQALTVSGLKGTSIPTLATGYLHYNGASFVWDTPSGGGGSVLVKTVDCTNAGTTHAQASTTAFDGTYVTVTGLGTAGAFAPGGYYSIASAPSLYGPALSGAAATVTAFDGVTNYATIGGLTGMYPSIVGKTMTFTGFGNAGNNGSFTIVAYVSSTSVKVLNATPGVSLPTQVGLGAWLPAISTAKLSFLRQTLRY